MKNRIILLFIPMFLLAGCNKGGSSGKKSSSNNQERSSSQAQSLPDKSHEVPDAEKGERISLEEATVIANNIKAYNETLRAESIQKLYLEQHSSMDDDFQDALLSADRQAQYFHSFVDLKARTAINDEGTEFYPTRSISDMYHYPNNGNNIAAFHSYFNGYQMNDSGVMEYDSSESKVYYHESVEDLAENVDMGVNVILQGYLSISNGMLNSLEMYLNPQLAAYAQFYSKGDGSLYFYLSLMGANIMELLYVDNVFSYCYVYTDLSTMGGIPGAEEVDVDYQIIVEEIQCSLSSSKITYPDLSEYSYEGEI